MSSMDARPLAAAPFGRRRRILFVAEAVSLAHLVRLATLARALDPARFEVWFAASRFPPLVFDGTDFQRRPIESDSAERVLERVERGQPPWEESRLEHSVQADLRLLGELRPDLVVGDFRLSLTISAPLSRTPYASLINAYWSPHAVREAFPMPEHPLIGLLGTKRVARRYRFALPFIFHHFARPLRRLRRRYGLPALGGLLETLTSGDHTLYPDVPELAPTRALPASHRYLGTVSWAPRVPLPAFWSRMDHARPLVYVTLGSSGGLRPLDPILEAARSLPVTMLVASAGRFTRPDLPENVWMTDFVPGEVIARQAALVVCNGGSTTAYQALEQGTPVLGLPFNFDQYLASEAVVRAGAGLYVRSGAATAPAVGHAIQRLLAEDHFHVAAQRLRDAIGSWDARQQFRDFVACVTGATPAARSISGCRAAAPA